jgi:hypothetical protein
MERINCSRAGIWNCDCAVVGYKASVTVSTAYWQLQGVVFQYSALAPTGVVFQYCALAATGCCISVLCTGSYRVLCFSTVHWQLQGVVFQYCALAATGC